MFFSRLYFNLHDGCPFYMKNLNNDYFNQSVMTEEFKHLNERSAYPTSNVPSFESSLGRGKVYQALKKTANLFKPAIPLICGVILLVSLMQQVFQSHYREWFTGNYIIDPLAGAFAGSISFGIPITSYVAGGELLHGGVSLIAVTAFIMTWTTVGLIMMPLETSFLGKRFSIVRNSLNFLFAIIVAIATVYTIECLS